MKLRSPVRLIGTGGGGGSSAIPGVDADAVAWALAVQANGGTYTGATLAAVSNFCVSAKASGYWSKLSRLNLVCGSDLTAARVPLKVGGGSATETITNIVGGDYTETGATAGIKGDGATKSFDTGWNQVARGASSSSVGLWAYVKGTESGGSKIIMGAANAGSTGTFALGWANGGTVEIGAVCSLNATEYVPTGASASKEGFLGVSTNGSRTAQYYQNGAALGGTAVNTGADIATATCTGLALNSNGTLSSWSTRYLRAYAITTGMSAAEALAFNTDMQTFQTALGRNV
jgi:hypothetical protein